MMFIETATAQVKRQYRVSRLNSEEIALEAFSPEVTFTLELLIYGHVILPKLHGYHYSVSVPIGAEMVLRCREATDVLGVPNLCLLL